MTAQVDSTTWLKVKEFYTDSVELVVPMMDSILQESEQLDSTDIIKAVKYKGRAFRKMGKYVKSIQSFKSVYAYAVLQKDSLLRAEAADQIGIMNTFMGNMSEGQKYLLEVADIYNKVGSDNDIADANNGLAIFYNDMGQTTKAVEMYNLALSQYEILDDTMGRANIHANLGMLYIYEKQFDLAEFHILMQGKLDTMMQTQWGLGFHHDFMGLLYRKKGNNEEALKWYKSALAIRDKLSSHYNKAESISGLSATYLALGNYEEAIKQANKILEYKDEHQSLSQQMAAYNYLSKAYESKEELDKALSFYKEYKLMSDSIYQRDMLSEIASKDALYQRAKKDEEIARLDAAHIIAENKIKNKNKIIGLGALALGVISLLLFILYNVFKKVTKQKDQLSTLVDEKDILLREIHHRVKNNLQIVSSLLTLQGRTIKDNTVLEAINDGKSRVRSMALIHQDLYSNDNLTGLNVKSYVENLTKDLLTTYKINQSKVNLILDVEDIDLDIDTMIPLGLIINEIMTNSLKYAFPNGRNGKINVSLKDLDDQLYLNIEDNGVGYNPADVDENSFGYVLVNALTDQLEGDMNISNDHGTKVEVTINDYQRA